MKPIKFILISLFRCVLCDNLQRRQLDTINRVIEFLGEATPFSIIDKALRLINPGIITGGLNLFEIEKPKLLKKPRKFKHASLKYVIENLNNSLVSTCPPKTVGTSECLCSSKYTGAVSIFNKEEDTHTVVVINKKRKQIVVSYRPTLKLLNVLDDLDFLPESVDFAPEEVKVHRGFYRAFLTTRKSTQRAVIKKLNNHHYRDYTLHITGYSLGAAIATISMFDWSTILRQRYDNRQLQLLTYSSPRVGNEAFANYLYKLNIPVSRFTIGNDLVPHTPPRALGFTHVGAEIHEELYAEKKYGSHKLRFCSQLFDEDPTCAWKNFTDYDFSTHLYPLGRPIKKPPFC